MITRIGLVLVCLLGFVGPVPAQSINDSVWIVRAYYDDPADISLLNEFDLLEYHDTEERYVRVLIDPDQVADLERLGFRVVLDAALTEEVNAPREIPTTPTAGIPGYPCYRTVEEAYALGQQLATDHPNLVDWVDIGDSWEKANGIGGYGLYVLKITNAAVPGPKPKLFLTGSLHAREYPPAELLTRFGEYLIDSYGTDADVTWVVDHHETHLMLMANPDGRKKAETGLSWRKNTNQDYCSPTSNLRGSDLNRNFEFEWACCGGASDSQCNELYRGPFAASEPEVQAVQDYLIAEFPDQRDEPLSSPAPDDATGVYMDIHSSGNLVIWPWGFLGTAPNGTAFQTFGRKLAFFNDYLPKQAALLYPTDGNTVDFGYGELGIAAMAYETGTSFFQDCNTFDNVVAPANLPSFFYAVKAARTPYLTPAGPDALDVTVEPLSVLEGQPFSLTATIDDTRYNTSNGTESSQDITAAEYYIDTPPWVFGSVAVGMLASDGSFDAQVESVTAVVSSAGLSDGQHLVFVRGRDSSGNWGAFSAQFIEVANENSDNDSDGVTNGNDCAPNDGSLWAPPSPARDLTVDRDPPANLNWSPPLDPGSSAVSHAVLRSDSPGNFSLATCLQGFGATTFTTDAAVPASGSAFHYLVRSSNSCGSNLGEDSSGQARTGVDCAP